MIVRNKKILTLAPGMRPASNCHNCKEYNLNADKTFFCCIKHVIDLTMKQSNYFVCDDHINPKIEDDL